MTRQIESLDLPLYPQGYHLQTERLQLLLLSEGDTAELMPLMSDSRLTRFLAWQPHCSIKETEITVAALIEAQRAGRAFHWVVRNQNQIVGLVSLIDVHRQHRCWTLDRAELAYWIGVPYQGKGYATEAACAITQFGFNQLLFHKIRVYHASDNPISGRTIEKLNFRFVGEEREAFKKDGVWHHLRHFELLNSEFRML